MSDEAPGTTNADHEQLLNLGGPPEGMGMDPTTTAGGGGDGNAGGHTTMAPAPDENTHKEGMTGPTDGSAHPMDDDDDDGGDDDDDDDDEEGSKKRSASMSEDGNESESKKIKLEGDDGKKRGRKPGSTFKRRSSGDGRGPSPSWNDMFFALMAFKAKLGTFNVPAQTKLGKWVTKQRQEYSKLQRKKIDLNRCHELSDERIQVLDSLGFIWDTMLHENDRRWNQRFEELKQWKDEHGHCNVPQSTSLGQWVKIQRENKREADLKQEGKLPQRTKPKPCLAQDRIEKLNSIGFQWRVAAPVTGWDNRYNQLLEYAKNHNGDVNVPQYYPQDKSFGRWVMKQRSEYSLRLRGLKSQLTDERVEKLNAIGFSWVAPNFKRKVGVGIAPGSPAANVAATMGHPDGSKLEGGDGSEQQMMHHHHQAMDGEAFQGLHHDPHQMNHHHHNPDQGHNPNMQHQHDGVEDVVNMQFL